MPRQARLDAPGTLHHVVVRGIERRQIVNDNRDRSDFVSRMGKIAAETQTLIYAWALLNNHAHIFLRSGPSGLPSYMRRLLSGYAISYNIRHRRHGHLFQNRYKSIVCEEDPYFKELIRYIHLNPLRAGLVDTLSLLDKYRWCGHSVLMGKFQNNWQDRDYVLKWFGTTEGEAKRRYRQFVKNGIEQGRRPELVGGGLMRSQGNWSAIKAMGRLGMREKSDERILGSGEFVEHLLKQADEVRKQQFSANDRIKTAQQLVEKICQKEKISVEALRSGSRRQLVSKARTQIAVKLVEENGLSLAQTARHLGVSTSAIAKLLDRRKSKSN
jgi:REP element-mobilizing transposase RayT/predicted HTH domain antitoxin